MGTPDLRPLTGFALAFLAALLLTVAQPRAGAGRRPIYQPIVIGPGDEGRYFVTRNIGSPTPIIKVLPGTGSVDIDLNGFSLATTQECEAIQVNAVATFSIRNGDVSGGISINTAERAIVEELTISTGECPGVGMVDVARVAIRRNIISGGEPALGVRNAIGGTIEDNAINGGDDAMLLQDLENVDVVRNRVDLPGPTSGINVDGCVGCRFADNLVRSVLKGGSHGLDLDRVTGSRISSNVISAGAGDGIHVSSLSHYNLIVENTVSDNQVGIRVFGRGNVIERNLISGNASWGLRLDGIDNVYKNNVASHNGGSVAACPGSGPSTTDLCDATSGGNLSPLRQPPLAGDNLMPDPR